MPAHTRCYPSVISLCRSTEPQVPVPAREHVQGRYRFRRVLTSAPHFSMQEQIAAPLNSLPSACHHHRSAQTGFTAPIASGSYKVDKGATGSFRGGCSAGIQPQRQRLGLVAPQGLAHAPGCHLAALPALPLACAVRRDSHGRRSLVQESAHCRAACSSSDTCNPSDVLDGVNGQDLHELA